MWASTPSGTIGFEPAVELLFDFVGIVPEGGLTPVEGFLAGHDEANGPVASAMLVDGEIADARKGVCIVVLNGSGDASWPSGLWRMPLAPECLQLTVWKGHIFWPGSRRISLPPVARMTMSSVSWSKLRKLGSKTPLSRSTTLAWRRR